MSKKINFENIETLQDFLNVLKENFLTAECKPGRLVKNTLARLILANLNASPLISEKVRINCTNADSLAGLIRVIERDFNTQVKLSEEAKKKLITNFNSIQVLTNLKPKP